MAAIMSHPPSALPEAKCPSSPTTADPEATRPRWRASLTAEALFLIGLAILAYWPVVECGYVWDDDKYLTDNRLITEPGGLVPIWRQVGATPQYYPMVFSTFWLEYRLWGLHPMGYHLAQIWKLVACLSERSLPCLATSGELRKSTLRTQVVITGITATA